MKVFGYGKSADQLEELYELTFSARPDELRKIAQFLSDMASELENDSESFGHAHMKDFCHGWPESEGGPDVIVFNPDS